MSAGLIISAILLFVSGISLIGGGNAETTSSALVEIYSKSQLIRLMVSYSYLWFSAPALAFLIHSLYTKKLE